MGEESQAPNKLTAAEIFGLDSASILIYNLLIEQSGSDGEPTAQDIYSTTYRLTEDTVRQLFAMNNIPDDLADPLIKQFLAAKQNYTDIMG